MSTRRIKELWDIPGTTKGVRYNCEGRECSHCFEYKLWEEFYQSPNNFMGYSSRCKICIKKTKIKSKYYQRNLDKAKKYRREYYLKNGDKIRQKERERYHQKKIEKFIDSIREG